MDRSLWLLLGLRAKGRLRRWARGVRSLKGMLLALVGALFFLPSVLMAFLIPRLQTAEQIALVRRHGAAGLLAYCVLNVLLSSGERALSYSPAEVNLLFGAPYSPRQLLIYRVASGLTPAFLSAVFATLFLQHHAASPWAAFVGLFLAFELLFLFSVAVSLFVGTIGAIAFNRQRKALLATLLAIVALALATNGRGTLAGVLADAESSRAALVILAPFRPFIKAFTAERVWPDLAVSAAWSLLVDLILLGLVMALNVQFVEASARASAARYERIRHARRGAAVPGATSARVRIPALPWLGGFGPNLWRQLTTAARSATRVVSVLVLFTGPLLAFLITIPGDLQSRPDLLYVPLVLLASLSLFAPTMAGFDFRPDLDRMEELKTLPIPPASLALGQVATPVAIISLGQWCGLALIAWRVGLPPGLVPAALILTPALNLVLVGVENLFFLWFPSRFVAGASADFQMLGRQLLMMTGRLACASVALGLAAGFGALAFFALNGSWTAAVAGAWLGLAVAGLGVVFLIAQAFQEFDVARDRLE